MNPRLFIAVPIPTPIAQELQGQLSTSDSIPGKPEPASKWHITLCFLGDTSPEQVSQIHQELSEIKSHPSFGLQLRQWGGFPSLEQARILWIGVEDKSNQLNLLHQKIIQKMNLLGFPPEARPYLPHLTISKIKKNEKNLLHWDLPPVDFHFRVSEFALYQSKLGQTLSEYHVLYRYPLDHGSSEGI